MSVTSLEAKLTQFKRKTHGELVAELQSRVDELKPNCRSDSVQEEVHRMTKATMAVVSSTGLMILDFWHADETNHYTNKKLDAAAYQERLETYAKMTSDMEKVTGYCLYTPRAFFEHCAAQHCTESILAGGVGAIIGAFGAAKVCHAALSAKTVTTLAGRAAVGGAAVAGAVAGAAIMYFVWQWVFHPTTDADKMRKRLEHLRSKDSYNEVQALANSLQKLRSIPGKAIFVPEDAQCMVCHETMKPCPHFEAKPKHDAKCAVLPFKCGHIICFACSPRLAACPLRCGEAKQG